MFFQLQEMSEEIGTVEEQLSELDYYVRQLEDRNLEHLVIAERGMTIAQYRERANDLLDQYKADLETE